MYIGDHAMSLVDFVDFELYVVCFMCTLVHLLLGTSNIFSICLSKKKKRKKKKCCKISSFFNSYFTFPLYLFFSSCNKYDKGKNNIDLVQISDIIRK